jgi:hypothetical protein
MKELEECAAPGPKCCAGWMISKRELTFHIWVVVCLGLMISTDRCSRFYDVLYGTPMKWMYMHQFQNHSSVRVLICEQESVLATMLKGNKLHNSSNIAETRYTTSYNGSSILSISFSSLNYDVTGGLKA